MNRSIVLTFAVLLFAVNAAAQPAGWESKAVGKWDIVDVRKILNDSAWGRSISSPVLSDLGTFGSFKQGIWASYDLRSALVVRFALTRKLQLEQKYDSMDEKSKAEFDKKNAGLLRCAPCSDYYIVAIRGTIPELKNARLIEQNKREIFLSNETGEKRYLAKFSPYTADGSEALFFFPRRGEDGKVLLSPDNKKLIFRYVAPESDRGSPLSLIRNIEINVPDIAREGVVVF